MVFNNYLLFVGHFTLVAVAFTVFKVFDLYLQIPPREGLKRKGTILKTKFISLFFHIFVQLIESTSFLKMICLSGIASTCLGLFFFAVTFPNIDEIFS